MTCAFVYHKIVIISLPSHVYAQVTTGLTVDLPIHDERLSQIPMLYMEVMAMNISVYFQ